MTIPTLLGTGGHLAGGQNYSSGNYYSNVGLGRCAMKEGGFTTEAYVSQIIRVPGTISDLSWRLDTAFGATLTLTLNKNSSSTALAVSVEPSTSGWVTDSTDSISVSTGDTLDFATNVGHDVLNYPGSFYCVSARFDATTASAQLLAAVGAEPIFPTTTQQFVTFLGVLGAGATTERDTQFKCLAGGTWQNIACYLESNTFSAGTTINNRKNSHNGSLAVSIPASTSGYFEDTNSSDKDPVSGGDLLDYRFVASESGSGSFRMDWIGAHFLATDTALCMIGGATNNQTQLFRTEYSSLFGGGNPFENIPRATGLFPYALKASSFTNYLTAASQPPDPGAATFTLLKNGNRAALVVSSPPGASGYFTTASADVVSFAVGDTCANEVNVTAGTVTWASASLLIEAT